MIRCDTYWARIYLGVKDFLNVEKEVDQVVKDLGVMVNLSPVSYAGPRGREYGGVLELINLPYSPKDPSEMQNLAIRLAKKLLPLVRQKRASVVFPDQTVLVETEE